MEVILLVGLKGYSKLACAAVLDNLVRGDIEFDNANVLGAEEVEKEGKSRNEESEDA